MTKFDASAVNHPTHQCSHCLVRRTGLCGAFGSDEGAGLADLEKAHLPVRVFNPGDIIYSQGDVSDYGFNLISGWIELHQDMPDGRRHVSQFLLPGAFFGLKPRGAPYSHAATTITTASVCAMPAARFETLRRRHPAFNERFIAMLERENQIANEALTMISQGSSLERVARILWGLAARISAPGPVPAGVGLKAPLTQRMIADAAGLTAIHVNRVLRRLREQRLARFHNGVIVVENPRRLAAIANEGPQFPAHWGVDAAAAAAPPRGGMRSNPKKTPPAPGWPEKAHKLSA